MFTSWFCNSRIYSYSSVVIHVDSYMFGLLFWSTHMYVALMYTNLIHICSIMFCISWSTYLFACSVICAYTSVAICVYKSCFVLVHISVWPCLTVLFQMHIHIYIYDLLVALPPMYDRFSLPMYVCLTHDLMRHIMLFAYDPTIYVWLVLILLPISAMYIPDMVSA